MLRKIRKAYAQGSIQINLVIKVIFVYLAYKKDNYRNASIFVRVVLKIVRIKGIIL